MQDGLIVSSDEWLEARKEILKKEKEFTRARDALSQARRDMRWCKVEKEYQFDGPNRKESFSDLFGVCNQLIIYHFMFGPEWEEGCPVAPIGRIILIALIFIWSKETSAFLQYRERHWQSWKPIKSALDGVSSGCHQMAATLIMTTMFHFPRGNGKRRDGLQL